MNVTAVARWFEDTQGVDRNGLTPEHVQYLKLLRTRGASAEEEIRRALGISNRADFVFTVSRDFVRSVQTPLLIAPDDVTAHPYAVAMEVAGLAPNSETTIYPWKDTQEHVDEVVEHARRFLQAHAPAGAGV